MEIIQNVAFKAIGMTDAFGVGDASRLESLGAQAFKNQAASVRFKSLQVEVKRKITLTATRADKKAPMDDSTKKAMEKCFLAVDRPFQYLKCYPLLYDTVQVPGAPMKPIVDAIPRDFGGSYSTDGKSKEWSVAPVCGFACFTLIFS